MATVYVFSAVDPPEDVEPGTELWDIWYYMITRATRGGRRHYVTTDDVSDLWDEVYEARKRRRDISVQLTDDLNPLLSSIAVEALQREEIKECIALELIDRVMGGRKGGKEDL